MSARRVGAGVAFVGALSLWSCGQGELASFGDAPHGDAGAPSGDSSVGGNGDADVATPVVATEAAPVSEGDGIERGPEVTLPIRVFAHTAPGAGSATEGQVVGVTLRVSNPTDVDRLYLRAHRIAHPPFREVPPKASVRLNGGAWLDIEPSTVTCVAHDEAAGCLEGGYATTRFTLPVTGVRAGSNQLELRYNGSDGFSSGYRVLDIALLRSDFDGPVAELANANAIDGTRLVYEDRSTWAPIHADSASIAEGRALWKARSTLHEPGGLSMDAACADCHGREGHDLWYFNYSDEAIVVRSQFHGLSERKGELIASFIRSRQGVDSHGVAYDPPGTPWDPPYQPGPVRTQPTVGNCVKGVGLDALPAHCWAAGAGLDAVLERDEDAAEALFGAEVYGDGPLPWAHLRSSETLNMRELPIALQMPDWNEWVPRIYPGDGYDEFYSTLVHDTGQSLEETVENGEPNDIKSRMEIFDNHSYQLWKTNTGRIDPQRRRGDIYLGLVQWHLVREWDVMQGLNFEEMAPAIYEHGEARSWLGMNRSLFAVAPHMFWRHGDAQGPDGERYDSYFDHAWYQHQITLNAGNREIVSIRPVDYKYHYIHAMASCGSRGGCAYQYLASYIKMTQQMDNGEGVKDRGGWYLRHATPLWLLSPRAEAAKNPPWARNVSTEERRALTEAGLQVFWDQHRRYEPDDWDRGVGDNRMLQPASYRPAPHDGNQVRLAYEGDYANQFYRSLPLFRDLGVDRELLREIAAWCERAWPLGDWSALVE